MPTIKLEHAYSSDFLVTLEGSWLTTQDTLTITITHKAPAHYADGTVAIVAGQNSRYQIPGQRQVWKQSSWNPREWTSETYTFVPNVAQPLMPQEGLPNTHPPHQPKTMQIKIVFHPRFGQVRYRSVVLEVPIGNNWWGTMTVSLSNAVSNNVSLEVRDFGLPSVYEALKRHQQHQPGGVNPDFTLQGGYKPRATYPVRSQNKVTFYNDASSNATAMRPPAPAPGQPAPPPFSCAFHDIYKAIKEARRFIFIADWSFHPDVYLQRPARHQVLNPQNNPPRASDPYRLGDILINKALCQAVNGAPDLNVDPQILIAIHVWNHVKGIDDPVSDNAGDRLTAMAREMGHNQLPPRLLWRTTERSGTTFRSHHQKFIALDAPVPGDLNGKREIKVFFGGLDLTTGRFDWPDHPLDFPPGAVNAPNQTTPFITLNDWYNAEFKNDQACLRQPWHDIHAQLVGSAAWDFVIEFVGRWEVGNVGLAKLTGSTDLQKLVWQKFQELLATNQQPPFVQPFDDHSQLPAAALPRPWTVQVLRSMEKSFWTSDAITSRNQHSQYFQWGLTNKLGVAKDYEKSIHKAYLQAIHRAQRFIYIETQYLIGGVVELGGSVKHSSDRGLGPNKIPEAIVKRILEVNRQNPQTNFHVYIVIPMFPEGAPNDVKLVPVRYFQWQTIQWMKTELQQKLPAGPGAKRWNDYLSFYFLGKSAAGGAAAPANADRKALVNSYKRYMIYVHSKMMIVDDEWIIIGSANLNERSMAGKVDSEICVAMWPSLGQIAPCSQQIQDFRRDLWEEHLGNAFIGGNPIANAFPQYNYSQPERPDTYNAVQQAATTNKTNFIASPPQPHGHLMLWDLNAIFPGNGPPNNEQIIDAVENDNAWHVAPQSRGGIGSLAFDEMVR